MAEFNSTQFTNLYVAEPRVAVHRNSRGELHLERFSYTQAANGAIGDTIRLVKVPGNARIIMGLSEIEVSGWSASTTLDLGWKAYTGNDGVAVAEDNNGLINGIAIDTDGVLSMTAAAVALRHKEFDARDPVVIFATINVAAPGAGDQLNGFIAYLL